MPSLPLVSIVTPTYNMASYLEETIESVLSQDYPHIEYLVMDAGSRDGTVELLERYAGRLAYVSEPDEGQADAVNKGFARTQGEIFAFLNADDTYLPGAIRSAVELFLENPAAGVVYGQAWYTAQNGDNIGPYPTEPFDARTLGSRCYICQPASFFRRSVFAEAGMLDKDLHYALDYDLWMRIARRHAMVMSPDYYATSRMYRDNKTIRLRRQGLTEIMRLLQREYAYIPPHWVYAYCSTWIHPEADGFFVPDPPTPHGFAAAIAVGSWKNRAKLGRYWADCARMIGPGLRIAARRLTGSAA